MAKLIATSGPVAPRDIELVKDVFSMGRMPENDLELRDSLVSRKHSELIRRGNRYTLYDLGSSNGTYVNKKRVDVKVLDDGDEVTVGESVFQFKDETAPKRQADAAPEPAESELIASLYGSGNEIVKKVADLPEEYRIDVKESIARGYSWKDLRSVGTPEPAATPGGPSPAPPAEKHAPPPVAAPVAQKAGAPPAKAADQDDRFKFLYHLGRDLSSKATLKEVLQSALDTIFAVINAERGVILTIDKNTGELVPQVARHRAHGNISVSEVVPSRTITSRVIQEKNFIITSDAKHDQRFQMGMSIIQYNIRSAMCVPLWEKEEVFGVIYLDNQMKTYPFEVADLHILGAIANQVAIRIKQEELFNKLKQEELIRSNMERFFSPDIAEILLKRGQAGLSPEEKEATIIFCDIAGFTNISEKMKPPQIAELLNGYFEMASRIILEHKGSVNKYIGDSIMSVFGAPVHMDDHAIRAVKAALAIQREVKRLNEKTDTRLQYHVHIGINTGDVVAGNIGSQKRIEYTVLGDAVNVAARLEKVAMAGQIVIGDRTQDIVKDKINCRGMGAEKLRGKENEIRLFEVLGER
ncbi:MAG: FHA domain-containing protein [Candidatus Brocadiae bacterium]|nr:FHA domain-containing protein [Candidatus Brocadiia bacterium]